MKQLQTLQILGCLIGSLLLMNGLFAQKAKEEAQYYRIETLNIPQGIELEVGGLAFTDDGKLGVSSRRGEVWVIDNPYLNSPRFRRFAHGLHEPLGLAWKDGGFYLSQRGELTRLEDTNGDQVADRYKTVYRWPLTGNYHEYSYGPVLLPDGDMLVTLNLAWVGRGASFVKWRGWMLKITKDGEMTPIATGMRSPAGFGLNAKGDIFYTENQGDWVGSGRMTHISSGDFVGNPEGLRWAREPESPVDLDFAAIDDSYGTLYKAAQKHEAVKPPSVWFPHTLMGISTSDIEPDMTEGKFGPFEGQLFVGDQGHSKIMRVFQEQVNGVYQGACFPFREGFESGILRLEWGRNATLFVGMTSRGWAATGKAPFGIQRLKWTGRMPFEIKAIRAMSDGFELEFTQPVDPGTAGDPSSFSVTGFTYHYHHNYGSPPIEQQNCPVPKVDISDDRRKVRLFVGGLREGFIHEIKAAGIRNRAGRPLLHDVGYYTLNQIPGGGEHAMDMPMNVGMPMEPEVPYDPAKHITTMPADWNETVDQALTINTMPGLAYDLKRFSVKAGSRVKLIFNNPDDMAHNLAIGKPGSADKISDLIISMGLEGPSRNYIPDSDLILYHTGLLEPEGTEVIYFRAPDRPGEYDYVCTYPGHSLVMRGTMVVN